MRQAVGFPVSYLYESEREQVATFGNVWLYVNTYGQEPVARCNNRTAQFAKEFFNE